MMRVVKFVLMIALLFAVCSTGISAATEDPAGVSTATQAPSKVNINTATLEELTKLDRIGEKYAQRIIDYRTNVGPFAAPEDIMKVKGIGEQTYETIKDDISVN